MDASTQTHQDALLRLARAPVSVFFLIAGSDGKIDRKEVAAFCKLMENPKYSVLDQALQVSGKSWLELVPSVLEGLREPIAELKALAGMALT